MSKLKWIVLASFVLLTIMYFTTQSKQQPQEPITQAKNPLDSYKTFADYAKDAIVFHKVVGNFIKGYSDYDEITLQYYEPAQYEGFLQRNILSVILSNGTKLTPNLNNFNNIEAKFMENFPDKKRGWITFDYDASMLKESINEITLEFSDGSAIKTSAFELYVQDYRDHATKQNYKFDSPLGSYLTLNKRISSYEEGPDFLNVFLEPNVYIEPVVAKEDVWFDTFIYDNRNFKLTWHKEKMRYKKGQVVYPFNPEPKMELKTDINHAILSMQGVFIIKSENDVAVSVVTNKITPFKLSKEVYEWNKKNVEIEVLNPK
ncbi:MAG: hypothetical protein ACRCWQ_09510 [Bacilli bacterium]